MHILVATAFSIDCDTESALRNAYKVLCLKLGKEPSYLIINITRQHDCDVMTRVMDDIAPGLPYNGGTTCNGLSDSGFIASRDSRDSPVLSLLAIIDVDGIYVTAQQSITINITPHKAGVIAAKKMIRRHEDAMILKKKSHSKPSYIWLSTSPGCEDEVLGGIKEVFGETVPIIRGSCTDNGEWFQLSSSDDRSTTLNGLTIGACYASA
jgi:hypothetical protein